MQYDRKVLTSGQWRASLASYGGFAALRRIAFACCGWFAGGLVVTATAIFPVPDAVSDDAQSPPTVALDQLLELPASFEIETLRPGGATRAEWRGRFAVAHADIAAAKEALEESLAKLEDLAAQRSNWNVVSPGGEAPQNSDTPLDYGLKQEIRGRREEVERAERALRALGVEANLVGVPEEWHRL